MDHRDLMSGRRRGLIAALLRPLLWLGQFPYRAVVAVRNRRYDRGALPVHRCGVPVISIGNLTTGGTGKTPLVCAIARLLRERDTRVAIVSRGYGRGDGQDHNDEAEELFARLPDVPHIQDADRVEAARIAVEELEAEVILMDDGFQHRRLHRDLNIVVIDATCPFGFGYLLPRGLLREPVGSLKRADLVIITRCDRVGPQQLDQIERELRCALDRHQRPNVAIVHCDHRAASLLQHPNQERPITDLKGQPVATLCGIGNPQAFEDSVRDLGATIVHAFRRPDHDRYAPETVRDVMKQIEALDPPPAVVVCTHKDLVKLRTDRLAGIPLVAVQIDAVFLKDEDDLLNQVRNIADAHKKSEAY